MSLRVRIFGWRGDAQTQVNVGIDNRQVVVTEETRRRLQDKLRAIQDADDSDKQGCGPVTLTSPQMQSQANVGAGNSPSGEFVTGQASIFIMPGGEGVQVPVETLRHA